MNVWKNLFYFPNLIMSGRTESFDRIRKNQKLKYKAGVAAMDVFILVVWKCGKFSLGKEKSDL
jgi:hypothetical protein